MNNVFKLLKETFLAIVGLALSAGCVWVLITVNTNHDSTAPEISGSDFSISQSVRNDKTGRWRLARVATTDKWEDYVVSYYKENFKSNDEIHYIVNFTTKQTIMVKSLFESMLSVTVRQYVDKEEHDANTLGTGDMLGEYIVYMDEDRIEQVE